MRRKALVAVVVVISALAIAVLIAPRTTRDETPALPVEEIVVAYPEEPASLNPYFYEGDSNATRDLLRPVLPTLLQVDPGLRYRPSLAIRVPSGLDVRTNPFRVTFHLDPEARWSDGMPITSADVLFTWQTIGNEGIPIADRSGYERITGLHASDDSTFTLTFDRAYPAWRDLFSSGDFILPKHALEGKDFDSALFGGPPVSGGPYMIESRTRGLEIVYRPNPQWWGKRPAAQRVKVQFIPDIETSVQLLEAARVDVIAATTQAGLTKTLASIGGVEVSSSFGAAWWELAFNHSRQGPNDVGLRGAVAAGFNRHGFVEALLKEDGRVLEHLRPGRSSSAPFSMWGHDPVRARALLPSGGQTRFRIAAPGESGVAQLIEKSVQATLRPVGLTIEPANPRTEVFYAGTRRGGSFDLALWERRGTPVLPFEAFFHSSDHPPNGLNYSLLASKQVDEAIDSAENGPSYTRAASDALMGQLATALPAVPLFEAKAYLAHRSGLTGMKANATIDGPFWNLAEWGTLP